LRFYHKEAFKAYIVLLSVHNNLMHFSSTGIGHSHLVNSFAQFIHVNYMV
jgi:hypothetical protein